MIEGMKGPGRVVVYFADAERQLALTTFADASCSIQRNGKTVGTWEPDEQDDCLRTFAELATSPIV